MAGWLIYALGGGFGHLTRASALARAAISDTRIRIVTNSPYASCVQRAMPELDIAAIDPGISVAEGRGEVLRQIESAAPDCLIVDTFPRGLGGELAEFISVFSGLTVLVQRDLNPRYSAAFELNAFIRTSFDLVLIPGDATVDSLGPFPHSAVTAPWLVRSCEEMFTRERARHVLELRIERPCVIVCAAGNPDELDWYGSVVSDLLERAPACDVRCISPVRPQACPSECWVSYWPAMDLYAAADVVVGGGGYNTIYECLAAGVPLVAHPWPRKYDRQNLRANRAASTGCVMVVEEPRQAVDAGLELLASRKKKDRVPEFCNGATEAAMKIQRAVASKLKLETQ